MTDSQLSDCIDLTEVVEVEDVEERKTHSKLAPVFTSSRGLSSTSTSVSSGSSHLHLHPGSAGKKRVSGQHGVNMSLPFPKLQLSSVNSSGDGGSQTSGSSSSHASSPPHSSSRARAASVLPGNVKHVMEATPSVTTVSMQYKTDSIPFASSPPLSSSSHSSRPRLTLVNAESAASSAQSRQQQYSAPRSSLKHDTTPPAHPFFAHAAASKNAQAAKHSVASSSSTISAPSHSQPHAFTDSPSMSAADAAYQRVPHSTSPISASMELPQSHPRMRTSTVSATGSAKATSAAAASAAASSMPYPARASYDVPTQQQQQPQSISLNAEQRQPVAYEENEEERLTRQISEVDVSLAELDAQMSILQSRQRELKSKRRQLQEELDRPMQLPYTRPIPMPKAMGGSSALIVSNQYWSQSFPWDEAALKLMREVFHIGSYRVSQREVLNATMARKDAFVIMPTGAGKSLLYQLPALLNEGVTLVISPLLSLMEDQCLNLRSLGIESYMFSSHTSKETAKMIYTSMTDKESQMRLLYVTPEKIAKSKMFLSKLERTHDMGKLVRIVIDEVHCCSSWGHDFRPDYKKLNLLKQQFPDVPILAVTATASERVVADCKQILRIQGCQFFRCSFNRPNLHFSVRDKDGSAMSLAQDMHSFISSIGHLNSSGIIYAYSKKETEELCALLRSLGLNVSFYHADVAPERRQRLHHAWVEGRVKIMVATNAFGLGINKPDVRFVLHQTMPQSVETYYQEAGRAGRDGLKAYCCLWYSPRDLTRQSTRVYAKQDMTSHLYPLVAYAHSVDTCRRALMSGSFAESLTAAHCSNMCDTCEVISAAAADATSPSASSSFSANPLDSLFIWRDLSEPAIQMCEYVLEATGKTKSGGKRKRRASATVGSVTQKQLVDEVRKKSSSIRLPKGMSRDDCERLVIELMLQGVLRETFRNTAYATLSYLTVDPGVFQLLKNGDIIIKIRFRNQQTMKAVTAKTTQATTTTKQGEADAEDSEPEALDEMNADPDADEFWHEDMDGGGGGDGGVGNEVDDNFIDDDEDDRSSEDMPIKSKRARTNTNTKAMTKTKTKANSQASSNGRYASSASASSRNKKSRTTSTPAAASAASAIHISKFLDEEDEHDGDDEDEEFRLACEMSMVEHRKREAMMGPGSTRSSNGVKEEMEDDDDEEEAFL